MTSHDEDSDHMTLQEIVCLVIVGTFLTVPIVVWAFLGFPL